jgi:lipid II isoglutaminyl synthase (glutamine-hydrolysing)
MPTGPDAAGRCHELTAPRRRPVRIRLAVQAGRVVGRLSRRLRLGEGAIIGGRVALAVDRGALQRLASGRRVVLVTGTNGKTTVAHLLAAVLRETGPVAHNETGANMADGAVAALMARPEARLAVLEVDELHLAAVAEQVRPEAVVLLNLTRDQLDRSTEVAAVARSIRQALQSRPGATVIANGDDPVIVAIADGVPGVRWVAAGANWIGDAALCPRCSRPLHRTGDAWDCPRCGLRRPEPDWWLDDGVARGAGVETPLIVHLPGEYNRRNALTAVAAAAALGTDPRKAAAAIEQVRSVAHRYAVVPWGGQRVTLLLAKNPAGWREILPLLRAADGLLLAVNAREADGRDTSWLWDIPFEEMPALPTVATGEAAADLALRLAYAEVPHHLEADPVRGLGRLPSGNVTVVANYTAFSDVWHRLDRAGAS